MCIIENLIKQKRQKDNALKRYDNDLKDQVTANKAEHEQKLLARIENFERVEMTVPETRLHSKDAHLEALDEKERNQLKFIDIVREQKKTVTLEDKRDEEKKEWIKASFWAPDNTPMVIEKCKDAPSKKLFCPAVALDDKEGAHSVKLKELIALKMDENELQEYICWTCQKPLVHQKISVLRKCGHVMCKECVNRFCFAKQTTGRCTKCDKEVSRKDVVDLKESGSAFSAHSNVEAKVVKPTFQS